MTLTFLPGCLWLIALPETLLPFRFTTGLTGVTSLDPPSRNPPLHSQLPRQRLQPISAPSVAPEALRENRPPYFVRPLNHRPFLIVHQRGRSKKALPNASLIVRLCLARLHNIRLHTLTERAPLGKLAV